MRRMTVLQSLIGRIGVPVEQGTASAGTVKTGYLTAGSGPPVLLLHGDGAAAIYWYPVIGPLSSYFRVIAPDIVGYGESDKPSAPYDRPCFSAWLGDFLDALGLQKTSLVGHSLGGAIALQFTLDHPAQVDRLVLVDSAALGKVVSFGVLLAALWSNMFPSRAARLRLRRYAVHNPENIDEALGEYGIEIRRMPGGARAFWQGRGRAGARIPAEQLGQITQETLIIWGEEDRFFPVAQAETAQKAMSRAQLHIIPKAGHLPYFDQPQAFNDVLVRFLKEKQLIQPSAT